MEREPPESDDHHEDEDGNELDHRCSRSALEKGVVNAANFVHAAGITEVCRALLTNYTVPFLAANDYLHRAVTGHCDWFTAERKFGEADCDEVLTRMFSTEEPLEEQDEDGSSARAIETDPQSMPVHLIYSDQPLLFLNHAGTRSHWKIEGWDAHHLQILHHGRKEWRVRRVVGTGGAEGTEAWAVLDKSEDGPYSSVLLESGDMIFVPGSAPHATFTLEPSVATSINWLDSSNWPGAREVGMERNFGPKLMQHFERMYAEDVGRWREGASGKKARFQGSKGFREWVLGSKQERAKPVRKLKRIKGTSVFNDEDGRVFNEVVPLFDEL